MFVRNDVPKTLEDRQRGLLARLDQFRLEPDDNGNGIECQLCGGARWVCEDHTDKPWGDASDRPDACHCGGAGLPCPACNQIPAREPDLSPGYRTIIDGDG